MTPESFKRSLVALDTELNLRKAVSSSCWVIERKSVVPVEEVGKLVRRERRLFGWVQNPPSGVRDPKHQASWVTVAEALESGRRGYRVVMIPTALDQQTYNMLCASDIQRFGGWAAFADALDQADEKKEEALEQSLASKRKILNAEVWDMMKHMNEKKTAKMEAGVTDMTYLLHGRYKQPGDKPLITLAEC